MYSEPNDSRFACLGAPSRIWAVSAIHAECGRLMGLHDRLYTAFRPGDRLVYLGNYGGGPSPVETIDELLTFRRTLMALPGVVAEDIVYLRGAQEEMWQKLLQIQFAPSPAKVLSWMLEKGMAPLLEAYGMSPREGLNAAYEGVVSLTRWTARIREAVRRRPGHDIFTAQWRRAAYTHERCSNPLLFVHAGIDPSLPLHDQGDALWWSGRNFSKIELPYNHFHKVIRGYDPAQGGVHINCVTATLDGGCGHGGNLVCGGFGEDGNLFDLIET